MAKRHNAPCVCRGCSDDLLSDVENELAAMRGVAGALAPLERDRRAAVLLASILLGKVRGFSFDELVEMLRIATGNE